MLEKYREFNEISVTRRLYRSGESEYQINNMPCRLMDIRELVMDTGIAGKAYSIVEQGRVDARGLSFIHALSPGFRLLRRDQLANRNAHLLRPA